MTNLISNVAYAVVDPISPSIWGEAFWSNWYGGNGTLETFIKAGAIGAELNEKAQIFHQLPRTNLQLPMAFSILLLRNTRLVKTEIGGYISQKLDTILQAAHVGLMYGDYAAGKKLTACVRLLTWAYFQTPKEKLPQQVHKVMEQVLIIAAFVNVGAFFWRRPILAAVTAVTVTAVVVSLFLVVKGMQEEAERLRQERIGSGLARKIGIQRQYNVFLDRPVESLNRLIRGMPIAG